MKTFTAKPKLIKRTIDHISNKEDEKVVKKGTNKFEFDETIKFSTIHSEIERKMEKTVSKIQEDPNFKPTDTPNYPKIQKPSKPVVSAQPTRIQHNVVQTKLVVATDVYPDSTPTPLDTTFFDDYTLEDPFLIENIQEYHMQDPSRGIERIIMDSKHGKPIKKQKSHQSSTELKTSGKAQIRRDNILYTLEGLSHKNPDVIEKSLLDFTANLKESEFFIVLRAYGLMEFSFRSLFDILKNDKMSQISLQVILLMCKDEMNCEFLTESQIKILVDHLKENLDELTTSLLLDALVNMRKVNKLVQLEESVNGMIEERIIKHLEGMNSKEMLISLQIASKVGLSVLTKVIDLNARWDQNSIQLILRHLTNATHKSHLNVHLTLQTCQTLVNIFVSGDFDIQVLILGIFINLTEIDETNRKEIASLEVNQVNFLSFLISKFFNMFQIKKKNEENLITAYIGILLGCFAQDEAPKNLIWSMGGFDSIVNVIQEFIQFQANLHLLTRETRLCLTKIIQNLLQ